MNSEVDKPVVLIVAPDDPGRKWYEAVPEDTYDAILAPSLTSSINSFNTSRHQLDLVIVTMDLPGEFSSELFVRHITESGYDGTLVLVEPDRLNMVVRGKFITTGEEPVLAIIQKATGCAD